MTEEQVWEDEGTALTDKISAKLWQLFAFVGPIARLARVANGECDFVCSSDRVARIVMNGRETREVRTGSMIPVG